VVDGCGHIYRAIFVIEDPDVPLSQLLQAAAPELAVMAAGDGARLIGDITWTVVGDRLIGEAPAAPVPAPDCDVDEIAIERVCDGDSRVNLTREERLIAIARMRRHGVSSKEMGRRLKISQRQVHRHLVDLAAAAADV
jgi:hypothetical protein